MNEPYLITKDGQKKLLKNMTDVELTSRIRVYSQKVNRGSYNNTQPYAIKSYQKILGLLEAELERR